MATRWLATILSASPQVQCFHGATGLLPHDTTLTTLPDIAAALQHEAAQKGLYTGLIHLNSQHGTSAAASIKAAQGYFIALLRNPIEVASSQFIAKSLESDRAQIAHEWLTNHRSSELPFAWLHPDDAEFARVVAITLKHYFECAPMVSGRLFLFETYTQDYGEIERLLGAITQGAITDCPAVEKAYRETGFLNQHHGRPVDWETIFFREWDARKRAVFTGIYRDTVATLPAPYLEAVRHYTFLRELCAA